MKKLYISIILLLLMIFLLTACFGKQEYAKVEVFSVENNTLLKTIDDAKLLKEIRKNVAMGESDLYTVTESIPDSENPEYYFVFYVEPDAKSSNFTLTIYKDSDFIFDEFSTKVTSNPPYYVIYRSSKVVQYLRGLI